MNKEILLIVDALANEKGVEKELIFEAVEAALATAAAKQYRDEEVSMRVEIDRKTGDYQTFRYWTVTDNEEEAGLLPGQFILLTAAQKEAPGIKLSDVIEEQAESVPLGRIAAQQAKQVILQKIREAERKKIDARYQAHIGELVTGVAKKVSRDYVILDLGDTAEGIIARDELIPREVIRQGDRVRAYLYAIQSERRPSLLLSRTHPGMLSELFKIEVPEIAEQVIEIKAVARDPGSRAKIAVKTNDGRIDPVGACVGMRGARVQAVSNELCGERVDIILWDDDPAQLVINAMAPAEVASIMADEATKTMDIAVHPDQLSQAIGRNGQNVRLASGVTGWKLSVMSEEEAEAKYNAETEKTTDLFVKELEIEASLAKKLAESGMTSLEDIAFSNPQDLANVLGNTEVDETTLSNRARDVLLVKELEAQLDVQDPHQDLLDLPGMTQKIASTLANHGIVSKENLADLAVDELTDMGIDEEKAGKLIMAARADWFTKE